MILRPPPEATNDREHAAGQSPRRFRIQLEEISTNRTDPSTLRRLFALAVLILSQAWLSAAVHTRHRSTSRKRADDLRAAYATPQDITDGKKCRAGLVRKLPRDHRHRHRQGRPNIAGQRAGIPPPRTARVQGRRSRRHAHEQCRQVPERRCTGQVAAYYASLDPAPPAPCKARGRQPVKSDP